MVLYVGLSVAVAGTRSTEQASAHQKFAKQGQGLKNMVEGASTILKTLFKEPPPGFTALSSTSAMPEISLLVMHGDRQKPSPAIARLALKPEIKEGLMQHADAIIGPTTLKRAPNQQAADSAKSRMSFAETPTLNEETTLSLLIESMFLDIRTLMLPSPTP